MWVILESVVLSLMNAFIMFSLFPNMAISDMNNYKHFEKVDIKTSLGKSQAGKF